MLRQQIPRARFARRKLLLATLVACVHFGGCAAVPPPLLFSRSPADRVEQEDDIREAVFRYRFELMQWEGTFFLSIDGKDPSDSFMARFAATNARVKKESGSYFKKDPSPGWLLDRSTGEKAVSFFVGRISWISVDQVEVRGGKYCGGLCADAGIYRVARKNGRWVVEEYRQLMVS